MPKQPEVIDDDDDDIERTAVARLRRDGLHDIEINGVVMVWGSADIDRSLRYLEKVRGWRSRSIRYGKTTR